MIETKIIQRCIPCPRNEIHAFVFASLVELGRLPRPAVGSTVVIAGHPNEAVPLGDNVIGIRSTNKEWGERYNSRFHPGYESRRTAIG